MKKLAVVALAATLFPLASVEALAQCNGWECCDSYKHHPVVGARCRYHYDQNVLWPNQYIPAARNSVKMFEQLQVNNGWRRQNILGSYHFDPNDNSLTQAGALKLKWILTQAPESRRMVYVERGLNTEQTSERMDSVRQVAGNLNTDSGPLQLSDTHLYVEGHPAAYVDATFVGLEANRPPPVLPANTSSAGAGIETQ